MLFRSCAAQCTHHEINDVAFAAVRHPGTGETGYDGPTGMGTPSGTSAF